LRLTRLTADQADAENKSGGKQQAFHLIYSLYSGGFSSI